MRGIAVPGKHHQAICTEGASAEVQPSPSPEAVSNDGLNPGAQPFEPVSKAPNLLVNGRDAVLLQTAKVCVYNPINPDECVTIRAVLDTGSQRSYTTQRASDLYL